MSFQAVEDARRTRNAIAKWKSKFSDGAETFETMGEEAFWHERLGVWGLFSRQLIGSTRKRYWNAFGRLPFHFRQNIIVEINPPVSGLYESEQGVIAEDGNGHQWIMHRGQLNTRIVKASGAMLTLAKSRFVQVAFKGGSTAFCYPVADIEEHAASVQERVADFVRMCAGIRGEEATEDLAVNDKGSVKNAEGPSIPENTGRYKRGPLPATTIHRRHADVWKALVLELDNMKIKYSNGMSADMGLISELLIPNLLYSRSSRKAM